MSTISMNASAQMRINSADVGPTLPWDQPMHGLTAGPSVPVLRHENWKSHQSTSKAHAQGL